jgi:AcrR family transcriptional regulator
MTPRADVSAERKQQILNAAMTVFTQEGLHEAKMSDIAQEAGLSKGTLYWYFDSKDALITALLEDIVDEYTQVLHRLPEAEGTVTERLRVVGQTILTYNEAWASFLPVSYEILGWALREPEVREEFRPYFEEIYDVLVTLIEQGIERGEFRDVDVDKVVWELMALSEGIQQLQAFFTDKDDWDDIVEHALNNVLYALKSREPTSQE